MSTPTSSPRIRSLDGLRGLAALIVLFDHVALMTPVLSLAYDRIEFPATGSWAWWVTMTPLHVFWAGPEAVQLFFVLSGVVLTLSAGRANFDWMAYFPRRLVRLYFPVFAAVLLAAVSMAVVPRTPDAQGSTWLARRAVEYTPDILRTDLTLLWGGGDFGLSPLWSLRWEVWFSLALPLFMIFAFLAFRWWPLKAAVIVAALVVGTHFGWPEFIQLSMFAVGSLIASHWSDLQRGCTWLLSLRGAGPGLLVVCVLLFTSRWWILPLGGDPKNGHWWTLAVLLGASLAVLLAAHWPGAHRFLCWGPMHWLGRISFSLYLVHESVVIAIRYLMIDAPMSLVALIALPAAILASWVFYHLVERPSVVLASKAGSVTSASIATRGSLTPSAYRV